MTSQPFKKQRQSDSEFWSVNRINIRKMFLERTCPKCCGEIVPNPFLKNKNCTYLWINSLKFYSLFILYAKLRAIEMY